MRTPITLAATVIVLASIWTLTADAQEPPVPLPREQPAPGGYPPPGPPGPPRDDERGPMGRGDFDQMNNQDVRELIETVKMVRLTKELGLTQEQTVVLVKQYNEYKERLEKLSQRRQERLRDLKDAVHSDNDDRIEAALKALIVQDAEIAETRRTAFNEVGKELTIKQKARLYVFLQEFDQDMRRLIQRARERGEAPGMSGPMLNRMREMREGRQGPFPQQGPPGRPGPGPGQGPRTNPEPAPNP